MDPIGIALLLIIVIAAMVFHELGHAYVAKYLGDDTASNAGRITLNPLKHIDPIGTLLIPVLCLTLGGFLFGWAKPVPVNPGRMRDPKRDMMYVALAGPAMNIVLAIISVALAFLLPSPLITKLLAAFFQINLIFAFFNMIPVPPLDGSRVLRGLMP